MFNEARGYAGTAPGQALEPVLDRLTTKDLQLIIGSGVLPLLPPGSDRDREALCQAAARRIRDRPRAIFADTDTRRTILRNLDPGKYQELQHRLNKAGLEPADDLSGPVAWPVAAGFFGLEPEETAGTSRPLPLQPVGAAFGLFPHQRSVVRRTYGKIGSGLGRTLIHMPTGSGKTRTAMHYVARILNESEPCVVAWLASSQELLEQAAETFEQAWSALGNREVSIHRFWGDYSADPSQLEDGILIGGLAKLHAWRNRDSTAFLRLSARTRLVVMDEAHQSVAPTYRALIDGLSDAGQAEAILGLTATPGRTWNDVTADEELADFFSNSKVVLEIPGYDNPVEYLLSEGYLARPAFSRIEYSPDGSADVDLQKLTRLDDFSDEMLDRIAQNIARSRAIISGVEGLIERGHRRIILFATSIRHAEDLTAALTAYGIEAYAVFGETTTGRRRSILRTFKAPSANPIVLCNFGVLTTGFDAPKTSAAIIARPTKSLVLFSQMVGRATRGPKAGGNAECEILTVHDPSYPGFGDIAEAFFNWEDVWNDEPS